MKNPDRPRIPLLALWRIPAVIALVACAIASRMALGTTGTVDLPGNGAASLREVAAAMVVCSAGDDDSRAGPAAMQSRGLGFDSRLLLDIAEAIYVLPPTGISTVLASHAESVTAEVLPTSDVSVPPPHCLRPDRRNS